MNTHEYLKQNKVPTVAFIAVIGMFTVAAGLANTPASSPADQVVWEGEVNKKIYTPDGELVHNSTDHNILTNEGANYFRSLATGQTDNAIDYIGLSNKSDYSTDVNHDYLEGEITSHNLSRRQAEITNTGTGEWELDVSWTSNGSIENVNAVGLFPHDVQGSVDSDSNILVAETTMNPKAFREDYLFEITWTITQQTG